MYKIKFQYMPDSGGGGGGGLSAGQAAGVSGAFGMAGTIIGAVAQKKANEKIMDYQNEWKYREREWALQDWNMQNEYNLPINQKKRLIEAGLNPALLYGKGGDAGSSSIIRAPGGQSANIKAPDFSGIAGVGQNSLMTYLAVQKQTAEIKQMEIQNRLLEEREKTQKALTSLTWDKAAFTETQNQQLQQIVDAVNVYAVEHSKDVNGGRVNGNMYVDKWNAEIERMQEQAIITAAENVRREHRNNASLNLIFAQTVHELTKNMKDKAEIGRINAQTDLIQKSGILTQFDIDSNEILNRRFDGPVGILLKGLLNKIFPGKGITINR